VEIKPVNDDTIRDVLTRYRVVAIVGLSRDRTKASFAVAEYLKAHGFLIVPINPFVDEVLGEKSHKSLLDMPVELQETVEIVDVFRPSADVPPIVVQAVQLKKLCGRPFVVWMQLGVMNEQATALAHAAGLTVIMDRCIMQEHKRLFQK
jgi:predicted CoA-binding protein